MRRVDLGRHGVWTSAHALGGPEHLGDAARAAEAAGFETFWLGGSPPVKALRKILAATETIVAATGILNVWQHEPADVARDYLELADEYPGRTLLGIGIGHPEATSDYTRPLKTMRDFFDGLAAVPRDQLCAAALGPKMLALAAERSLGTHPYFTTPAHTAFARETVGPDALVAPELACVIDTDPASARAKARAYAALYLGLTNYTSNLLRFGFTEADIADGGSDRLIDVVVPHGSAADVVAAAQRHFDAGADHVCFQPVGGSVTEDWAAIARSTAR